MPSAPPTSSHLQWVTTSPGDADTPCRAPAAFFHSIAHPPKLGR